MDVLNTIAGTISALAAVAALVFAYLSLREAAKTVGPLRDIVSGLRALVKEGNQLVAELQKAEANFRASTMLQAAALHETRAARYVDQLQAVRQAVEKTDIGISRVLRDHMPAMFYEEARADLLAALGGLPQDTLPAAQRLTAAVNVQMADQDVMAARVEVDASLLHARAVLQAAQAEEAGLLSPPELQANSAT